MSENPHSASKLLVVHLATFEKTGGAAIAAWRLHEGLRVSGVKSRMVTRFRSSECCDVSCISSDTFRAIDFFHKHRVTAKQPPGGGYFSFAPVSVPLMDHPWIAAADVVHLHWIAHFICPEDIQALYKAGKTVFMSLHDEWAFTGGCHYIGAGPREEDEWTGIHQIDEALRPLAVQERERKRLAFSSPGLHVIAPSRWMAREAADSGIFSPEQIHVVPYGFDLTIFHPPEGDEGGGDPQQVTLVFGCQSVDDRRKGYMEFRAALDLCVRDPEFAEAAANGRIRVVTFGKPPEDQTLPVPVIHRGELDETGVADLLRSASAFVCPTLDDNLPNVVMESLSCGCPVLGFSTGGVPDMVTDAVDGLLVSQGDVSALADVIKNFSLHAPTRDRLRDGALAKDFSCWNLATQARRVTELYHSVMPQRFTNPSGTFPEAPRTMGLECRLIPSLTGNVIGCIMEESATRHREQDYKIRKMTASIGELNGRLDSNKSQLQTQSLEMKKLARERRELIDRIGKQKERIDELKKSLPVSMRKRLRRFWKSLRGAK